ncbi:MAG: type II toxin-antitoxin system HicA family toxin [Bacillota bacterium]
MSQLPVLSGKEIIRLLKTIGFKEVNCKGSHVKLKAERGKENGNCSPAR